MTANLRSWGQQSRHARVKRNEDERAKLLAALKKQEAALVAALKDVRAILKEIGPY